MKKILFYLILSMTTLSAFPFGGGGGSSTLVVDNTTMMGMMNCEGFGFFSTYSTIHDAINAAGDGDTIKICKGDYNEQATVKVNNLTITSGADVNSPADVKWHSSGDTLIVDGNAQNFSVENVSIQSSATSSGYKNIHIKSAKNQITFQNLAIKTDGAEAIYVENNVNANLKGSFKDLTIVSGGDGIYINKGAKQEFENLDINITIDNANYYGIKLSDNVKDEDHSFKDLSFSVKQGSAIYLSNGKDMDFEDINVTASDYGDNTEAISLQNNISGSADLTFTDINMNLNAGVGININKAKDTKFKNISIIGSSQWAIWLRDNVTGTPNFENITIEANKEGGIKIQKGKNVQINTATIKGINGNGFAVWLTNNVTNNHDFKDVNVTTNSQGILVKKGQDIDFENITIQGNGNDKNYYGIHTTNNVTGNIQIKNCDINVSGKAIYINKGKPKIQDSRFETRMEEKTLYFSNNVGKVELKDSCIYKDYSQDDNAYGLYLYNGEKNNKIENNCFYKTPKLENLAAANTQQNNVDKNYWDGLSDSSYNYHNIIDNNPLSSCPNSCDSSNTQPKPIANYQMDECSWDGTTGEVKDSSDNHYDGTAKKGANTETNSSVGGGICHVGEFDGSDYVEQNNIYDILKTTASLSFWIKTTQSGDDTMWKAPGVTGVEEAGGGDDVFWGWIDASGHIGILKGNTDGAQSTTAINDNTWHHIVLTRDSSSGDTEVYVDGNIENSATSATGDVGNSFNRIGSIEDTGGTPTYFKGYLDEVEIYDSVLSSTNVKDIYNNEKDKKNYDGTDRKCQECGGGNQNNKNSQFDAWDTFRDINDRNISTEIVNRNFNLTIASLDENGRNLQDFNGTVCCRVVSDNYNGDWNNTQWTNDTEKNASFTVDRAIRDANITIQWKKNFYSSFCPLSNEDNETNASDDFAIRPKNFVIQLPSSKVYAGEDFNISFYAKDESGGYTKHYNEELNSSFVVEANDTKAGCKSGTLKLDDFNFSDGKKEDVNASYDDIGDINFTIKEKDNCNQKFAYVDCKDANISGHWNTDDNGTNDVNLTIAPATKTEYDVEPYELNVTVAEMNTSTNKPWLYMANVNDINLTLFATVQANDKQHNKMTDFNSTCYAKDVNLSFGLNVLDGNGSTDMNYTAIDGNITDTNNTLADINKTIEIYKNSFVAGEGNASYALNVDRNYSKPINPFKVKDLNVTVTTTSVSKNENNKSIDGNATFYYGRVRADDIITQRTTVSHLAEVEVYDNNSSSPYVSDFKRNSLKWYRNGNDNISTDILDINGTKGTKLNNAYINISSFNIDTNGTIKFDINNSTSGSYYMHIKTHKWLWYIPSAYGDDYNDSVDSNCTTHPCFIYTLENTSSGTGNSIKSGDFNGSDYKLPSRGDLNRTGIKVYR